MCRCPTRGEMSRADAPPTGTMRRFSRRYGMKTTPWASGPASGGCTVRLGAGSFSTLTTVLCAKAPATSRALAATATSVLMSGVIAKSPLGVMTPDDYLSRLDPGVAFAASVYISSSVGTELPLANRQLPVGPDEVAGVAAGILQQVILMLRFSFPEITCRDHFGDDLAGPQA